MRVWKYKARWAGVILPDLLYRLGGIQARFGPQGVAVDVSVGLPRGCVAVGVGVDVKVGVAVKGGGDVNVAVGGWELCRVMRGVIQRA